MGLKSFLSFFSKEPVALLLAALKADGKTTINNVEHLLNNTFSINNRSNNFNNSQNMFNNTMNYNLRNNII